MRNGQSEIRRSTPLTALSLSKGNPNSEIGKEARQEKAACPGAVRAGERREDVVVIGKLLT